MIRNLLLATSQSHKYPTMGHSPLPIAAFGHISYPCRKMGICSSKEGTAAAPSATPSARNGVSATRIFFSILVSLCAVIRRGPVKK